ncbi:MAG: hypothetical protein M3317_00675 [Actinomycetota bacterium]|nr:hypothetical protein [Actinomycetota bacterium]
MIVDRYDPVNLSELIPELRLQMEPELAARSMGVQRVGLPKKGAKKEERQRYERQGWFRRAKRFRAGIEGRIWVASDEILCLHPLEEHIVIEQFVKLGQLRFELKSELGNHLEEVYGIVSIDYHDG